MSKETDWYNRQVNSLPEGLSNELQDQAVNVLTNILIAWPQGLIENPKAKLFKAIAMDHVEPPDLVFASPDPELLRFTCAAGERGVSVLLTGHRTARYIRTLGDESTAGELVIADPGDGWGPLLRWVAFGEQA